MNFKKFFIIPTNSSQVPSAYSEEVEMLINLDHIISIKPIKISRDNEIIDGYWMRMSNGKKYRASHIPDELLDILDDNDHKISSSLSNSDELTWQ